LAAVSYAEAMELNVWTKHCFLGGEYNSSEGAGPCVCAHRMAVCERCGRVIFVLRSRCQRHSQHPLLRARTSFAGPILHFEQFDRLSRRVKRASRVGVFVGAGTAGRRPRAQNLHVSRRQCHDVARAHPLPSSSVIPARFAPMSSIARTTALENRLRIPISSPVSVPYPLFAATASVLQSYRMAEERQGTSGWLA